MRTIIFGLVLIFTLNVYGNKTVVEDKNISDEYDAEDLLDGLEEYFNVSKTNIEKCLHKTDIDIEYLIETEDDVKTTIEKASCFLACIYQHNKWMIGNQLQINMLYKRTAVVGKYKNYYNNYEILETCIAQAKKYVKPCDIVKEFEVCVLEKLN